MSDNREPDTGDDQGAMSRLLDGQQSELHNVPFLDQQLIDSGFSSSQLRSSEDSASPESASEYAHETTGETAFPDLNGNVNHDVTRGYEAFNELDDQSSQSEQSTNIEGPRSDYILTFKFAWQLAENHVFQELSTMLESVTEPPVMYDVTDYNFSFECFILSILLTAIVDRILVVTHTLLPEALGAQDDNDDNLDETRPETPVAPGNESSTTENQSLPSEDFPEQWSSMEQATNLPSAETFVSQESEAQVLENDVDIRRQGGQETQERLIRFPNGTFHIGESQDEENFDIDLQQRAIFSNRRCVICLVHPRAVINHPCMHACYCMECAGQRRTCSICACPITSFTNINL